MRSIIFSLVLALSLFSIVFGQVHSDVDSAHSDFNITAWLRSTFSRRTETYKQAIELLSTYDTFPSCHRLAVGALFETCGSAPSVDMDGNHILEDEKNLFAARLAVCELKSANAVIDEVCLGMVPNESSKSSFFPWSSGNVKHTLKSIYEEVDPTQRDACIKSLHSSTQSWTSYSNARQNAVLMCDTARAEINRGIIGSAVPWFMGKTLMSKLEEMLNIYKAVTVFSSVTIKELLKVLEQVHTFFGAVGHFQTKLSEELGLASAQILANITSAMETLGDISREFRAHVDKRFDQIEVQLGKGFHDVHTSQVAVGKKVTVLGSTITGLRSDVQEQGQKNQDLRDEVRAALEAQSSSKGAINNVTSFTAAVWVVSAFMVHHLHRIYPHVGSCAYILLGFFVLCTLYGIDELAAEVLMNISKLTNQIVSLPAETLKYIMLATGSLMILTLILVGFKLKRTKAARVAKSAKLIETTSEAVDASA